MLEVLDACCPNGLLSAHLDWTEASRLSDALRAIADPARLRILTMVASTEEVCGCELTGPLGLSQPTVSHHLKVLHQAGLLDRQQRGRWAYYRLRPDALRALRDALPA